MLFSEKYILDLPGLEPFENPWVVTVCKVPELDPLKVQIEKWYDELPDTLKPRFRPGLLSKNDDKFITAFHEIVIYRYCIEEGWEVEYEPVLDNGLTPDLLVHTKDKGDFIIEITTLFDSANVAAGVVREIELVRRVSAIKTEFVLEISFEDSPLKDFNPKKFAAEVEKWLDQLPDDKERHRKLFNVHGCTAKIVADKTLPKPRIGCILMIGNGGAVPDYSKRLKTKLDDKRRKYSSKQQGIPLLIVVGDGVGHMRVDRHLIDRTLFGQDQLTIYTDDSKAPRMSKDRSGYFTPSNDTNGKWIGKNTGVSAVLLSSYNGSEGYEMEMFHNPLASVELPYELFSKLPQMTPIVDGQNLTLKRTIGTKESLAEENIKYRIKFE